MQFILEQQAQCTVLHAKNEASHAEQKAEIKEIRRLMLKLVAMQVEDRKLTQEIKQKVKALAREGRETRKELRAFIRSLRGRPRNDASRN
jgi:hypothetical protein